jgi:hypothetical protein
MPSYIYMGHGNDNIIEGRYDYQTVPPRCNYLTISKSGSCNYLQSCMNLIKINLTYKGQIYIREPVKYYNQLSILASGYDKGYNNILSKNDLHLKREGQQFINNFCDFLFIFGEGRIKYLYKSGLYDMEKVTDTYLPLYKPSEFINHDIQTNFKIDTLEGIDLQTIKLTYKDSIFPTSKAIIKEIKRVMKIPMRPSSAPSRSKSMSKSGSKSGLKTRSMSKNSFNFNMNTTKIPYEIFVAAVKTIVNNQMGLSLMKKYPGNHYNFVCRNYTTNDIAASIVFLHRQQSNAISNEMPRKNYNVHKTKRNQTNFEKFIFSFFSSPNRTPLVRRFHPTMEHCLEVLNSHLDIYLEGRFVRDFTITDFIDDLTVSIGEDLFTVKEVPIEIMGKIKRILRSSPENFEIPIIVLNR